jgi:hypothetical protein
MKVARFAEAHRPPQNGRPSEFFFLAPLAQSVRRAVCPGIHRLHRQILAGASHLGGVPFSIGLTKHKSCQPPTGCDHRDTEDGQKENVSQCYPKTFFPRQMKSLQGERGKGSQTSANANHNENTHNLSELMMPVGPGEVGSESDQEAALIAGAKELKNGWF